MRKHMFLIIPQNYSLLLHLYRGSPTFILSNSYIASNASINLQLLLMYVLPNAIFEHTSLLPRYFMVFEEKH